MSRDLDIIRWDQVPQMLHASMAPVAGGTWVRYDQVKALIAAEVDKALTAAAKAAQSADPQEFERFERADYTTPFDYASDVAAAIIDKTRRDFNE